MKNIILIAFVFTVLTGCASLSEIEIKHNDVDHEVRSDRKYMSCDINFYQVSHDGSGPVYGSIYQSVANRTFIYALMSSNAYADSAQFIIPGWKRIRRYGSGKGFSADIWLKNNDKEVVIAYRGTDFFEPQDWVFGNFNVYWKGQYQQAESVIDTVSKDFNGRSIISTGHSLGGGLAIHGSLYKEGVNAVVFNASPRIFNSKTYKNNSNSRLMISEKGETLEVFRKHHPALNDIDFEGPYDEFDFVSDLSVIEHGSYFIARGLTAVSASTGNKTALSIMEKNLGCEF